MIRWIYFVVLSSAFTFQIASGRPKSQTLLRGNKLGEPEQVVVHTRMKNMGEEESQRIEIRQSVESPGTHAQPKTTTDNPYESFSITPERLKSGKKSKKNKYESDKNVFGYLLSKKSKKDSKKTKYYYESKPVDNNNETAAVNEAIPSRNRKHSILPIERNAPVYKSIPTSMPTTAPTRMPTITPTLKPTTIPTTISATIPTTTPTIISSHQDENSIESQRNDDIQSIYDEIRGKSEISTRHPKRVFPRPPLHQNHESTSPTSAMPSSEAPSSSPVQMPTRHRNHAMAPTGTQITGKYRDDDRRDGLNGNDKLCDGKNDTIHDAPTSSVNEAINVKNGDPIVSDDEQNDTIHDAPTSSENEAINEKNDVPMVSDDKQNDTIHDAPTSSENEVINDENDVPMVSDEKQNDEFIEDTTEEEMIIEDVASNIQNKTDIDQEPTDDATNIQNKTDVDEEPTDDTMDPPSIDQDVEAIEKGDLQDELINRSSSSNSNDHDDDDTDQGTVENEKADDPPKYNNDKEVATDQKTAAPSDETSSIDSAEKNSRSTWKKVVTGLVPTCLVGICVLSFLYYRASRRKNKGFGGIQNYVETIEKIDNTIPLDKTGGSGYSRMNSIKSIPDFDDSKLDFTESSGDLNLLPQKNLPRPTGVYNSMPNRYNSNSINETDQSNLLSESDRDGQMNFDNFTDKIDGENVHDDTFDDDEVEEDDEFYVYNYDNETEEIEEMDSEESDESDVEESSSSSVEEEFLSTIEEESQSYHFSTSESNSRPFSTPEHNRLTSW